MSEYAKQVPQEVIVVEGRDDTRRLIEVFGPAVKTIETNGSAIDKPTIERIRSLMAQNGVIVLTDPDYQGERIRRVIEQAVPQVKHAYITREEGKSDRKNATLGVEHASSEAIRKALNAVMALVDSPIEERMTTKDLIGLRLTSHPKASLRREYIANQCNLGHVNAKQFARRVSQYGIQKHQIEELLKEGEENGYI